jgi:hypothetical protein
MCLKKIQGVWESVWEKLMKALEKEKEEEESLWRRKIRKQHKD